MFDGFKNYLSFISRTFVNLKFFFVCLDCAELVKNIRERPLE